MMRSLAVLDCSGKRTGSGNDLIFHGISVRIVTNIAAA